MTYVYLTRKQVVEIHRRGIKYFGGSPGILNEGLLDFALMRPQQGYYNSLTEEASALLESLATNHVFIHGNKRVAFFTTDAFLRLNGYFIDCHHDEADCFIRTILIDRENRLERIQEWLKANIKLAPE